MDHIHPLDDFWFDGEPPDKIENILRRKRFETFSLLINAETDPDPPGCGCEDPENNEFDE